MTATTFLTGRHDIHLAEPLLTSTPRLSLRDGLRLLRTPSSEVGVRAYHRALEGAPVPADTLLRELAALREGRTTRVELLTQIATSPPSLARNVSGPGLLLLRVARRAFIASGVARRIRNRRALAAASAQVAEDASGAGVPVDIQRKLVLIEGAVLRLENRPFAQARSQGSEALAALEARVEVLEAELRNRLLIGSSSGDE